jgi:5-methylcytosine-specific restriction endonuclease McrA
MFKPEFDHIIPLIAGGENRESNIQALCTICHGNKTAVDVREKSKVARIRVRHLGLKKPKRPFPKRDDPWGKKWRASR